jgi:hypothetical protein
MLELVVFIGLLIILGIILFYMIRLSIHIDKESDRISKLREEWKDKLRGRK